MDATYIKMVQVNAANKANFDRAMNFMINRPGCVSFTEGTTTDGMRFVKVVFRSDRYARGVAAELDAANNGFNVEYTLI